MKPQPVLATLILAVLLPLCAFAEIPEPPVLLFGQVGDGNAALFTSGAVSVTLTPQGAGDTVQVPGTLSSVAGEGETFSYTLSIPVSTTEPSGGARLGDPMSFPAPHPNPLPGGEGTEPGGEAGGAVVILGEKATVDGIVLPDAPQAYMLTLSSGAASTSYPFTLSRDTRGLIERVDLDPPLLDVHTADTNGDNIFSMSELGQIIALFSTPRPHAFHSNLREKTEVGPLEDGYAAGAGVHLSRRHSSDYDGLPWELSLSELLRSIELHTATPDHAYHKDAGGEDGFSVGSGAGAPPAPLSKSAAGIKVERTLVGESAGQLLVTITLQPEGGAPLLTALGLEEMLPAGWRYAGLAGGDAPGIAPEPGTDGLLEFAWLPVPSANLSFSYRVAAPESSAKSLGGIAALSGRALYRLLNAQGEQQSAVTVAQAGEEDGGDNGGSDDTTAGGGSGEAASNAPILYTGDAMAILLGGPDLDRDNIANRDEGDDTRDDDADGIPNFLDEDSDGDGIADRTETARDADADGAPNYLDEDSDNDGTADAQDGEGDADGDGIADFEDADSGLPLSRGSLALTALALAACGLLALRSREGERTRELVGSEMDS